MFPPAAINAHSIGALKRSGLRVRTHNDAKLNLIPVGSKESLYNRINESQLIAS
jgi:hypothetical protein